MLGDNGEDAELPGIPLEDFRQYYDLWEDWHYFHVLPHGGGTNDEKRWVLSVIKMGIKAWDGTEAWIRANPKRAAIQK